MRSRMRSAALRCSLPERALALGARVTMFGDRRALVEGQSGVVELAEDRIRLRTAHGVLCIQGEALRLLELTADAAMIAGERVYAASYGALQKDAQRL